MVAVSEGAGGAAAIIGVGVARESVLLQDLLPLSQGGLLLLSAEKCRAALDSSGASEGEEEGEEETAVEEKGADGLQAAEAEEEEGEGEGQGEGKAES